MPGYAGVVTAGTYECLHSGTWTVIPGALNKALDAGLTPGEVVFGTMAMAPNIPCTSTIPTTGLPICLHTAVIIATSVLKTHGGVPAALAADPQISLSNGTPATMISAAETINVVE